jgi:hypothetical protein
MLLAGVASPVSASSGYIQRCSRFLSDHWRRDTAVHAVDSSLHLPVVLINVPVHGRNERYPKAIGTLKAAFPSFEEARGSGILLGCCAIPVWGAISFEDLTRLKDTRFAALCAAARRSRSTAASVRIEFRATYDTDGATDPYFFSYWTRKPHP